MKRLPNLTHAQTIYVMLPYLLFYKIYKTIQSNNVYSTATLFHSHYFMQSPMKYNFISFHPPPLPNKGPLTFTSIIMYLNQWMTYIILKLYNRFQNHRNKSHCLRSLSLPLYGFYPAFPIYKEQSNIGLHSKRLSFVI